MLAMNAVVMGPINTDETTLAPRCSLKNPTTPSTCCSLGTYTLRYMRSMLASSSVTCSLRISATVRSSLIVPSLQTVLPQAGALSNPHRATPPLVGLGWNPGSITTSNRCSPSGGGNHAVDARAHRQTGHQRKLCANRPPPLERIVVILPGFHPS